MEQLRHEVLSLLLQPHVGEGVTDKCFVFPRNVIFSSLEALSSKSEKGGLSSSLFVLIAEYVILHEQSLFKELLTMRSFIDLSWQREDSRNVLKQIWYICITGSNISNFNCNYVGLIATMILIFDQAWDKMFLFLNWFYGHSGKFFLIATSNLWN